MKRLYRDVMLPVSILVLAGGFIWFGLVQRSIQPSVHLIPPSPAALHATLPSPVDHIVIIVEENKPASSIVANPQAPYINSLFHTAAEATNYQAITHPSLPNYLALTSGTTAGITSDCNPPSQSCQASIPNITDQLTKAGKSWKAYMESMPTACDPTNSGEYAVKHNPFLYYPDITSNRTSCQTHDVPFSALTTDLARGTVPNYVFITPNLCNDMHDCSITTGDSWLSHVVPHILSSNGFTKEHSLLVITWDEGDSSDNTIPTLFLGPLAKAGTTSPVSYSHYSLLHTIEALWHLPPLTPSVQQAPVMTDMLRASSS